MTNLNDQISQIAALKKERNAIILAHNYQIPAVQDLADYHGDSLGLAIEAGKTDARVIVLCGVHFMAETCAILNPAKLVLLPEREAGCPMADMVTAEDVIRMRRKHPGASVVAYVNTSAAVKAEADYCCTSANAAAVVAACPPGPIIFVPDKNLGSHAAKISGREVILYPGFCPTHERLTVADILEAKKAQPSAKVIVHPECRAEVREIADAVLSTGGMDGYVKQSDATEFIIGTECGMLYPLGKANPTKRFYLPGRNPMLCPNMKLTSVTSVLCALTNLVEKITVPEEIARRAKTAIDRMMEIGRREK
jgi:quinolinate synthase